MDPGRTQKHDRALLGEPALAPAIRHQRRRQSALLATLARMLPPYVAVLVFWNWRQDAWACILAYHAFILLLSRWHLLRVHLGWNPRVFMLVAPLGIAAGPLAYALLPHVQELPVGAWLADHGLAGPRLWWMVPYFGIVHPILEQAHWSSLRARRRWGVLAHLAFAGYHALVLVSLLSPVWIAVGCTAVFLASLGWRRLERWADGGLAIPVVSHILADSGLVLAALLRAG